MKKTAEKQPKTAAEAPAPAVSSDKAAKKPKRFTLSDTSALPVRLSYLYLAIPMYMFIFGWLKLLLALLMGAILTFGLYLAWKDAPQIDISFLRKNSTVKLLCLGMIVVFWLYLSGVGGYCYQNADHHWRNAILRELVDRPWPVVYTDVPGSSGGQVAMVYYFMLWLPAALWGKIFGFVSSQIFLYFWCLIGILLTLLLVMGHMKKCSVWIVLAFIFFSGLDTVGDFVLNNSPSFLWFSGSHLEHWANGFQFSSMSTQLFWVYNQAIPAWLITMLLLVQKDNRSVIFIYAFSFLFCTLPAVGLVPILAFLGIRRIIESYDKALSVEKNVWRIIGEALTFQNLICGCFITLLSYLFLTVNSTTTNGFHMAPMELLMPSYLLFIFLEVLVYFIAIYKYQGQKPMYAVCLVSLLIIPVIRCGYSIDFCMRASIPALLILMLMVMDTVAVSKAKKDWKVFIPTVALLLVGSLTAYHEMDRSIGNSVRYSYDQSTPLYAEEVDLLTEGLTTNFLGESEDSIFFKYLAK